MVVWGCRKLMVVMHRFSRVRGCVEEFEAKQKEVEGIVNPIMMKVYQAAGGDAGATPGAAPGAPGAGAAPTGNSSGPTVEEVD
ncbi:conserved hypothetical protein [Perkinsus marinus ATCC 50983]|uniref:Uncharacterized protein n=1 Tax=Perkinsus marinus (strain ATCC 50983 / TXsc) TaxID=423536 RepID=C5LFX3_PERM5|nr:conserved hypothetical protein [Perkinsus marinus ATCC 50983]EER04370.1 conserved hypothetical protein [Perkinsus marinus ATCC 50983]|eukprot:XP_002772554.1 conserved hypothetical protein [Perkinsus marinus ATCC 50983]